jgi:pimeloyl-ACP methyl ester carboxylesterase
MVAIRSNGITLDYEERGAPEAPAFLLLRGLGTQRIHWPDTLLDGLVARGFRVVCPDNRDVGLSEKFDAAGAPDLVGAMGRIARGEPVAAPYTLSDMAADGVGLLDALGISRAHLAGISMGGMIAQHVAARSGECLHSVASIMSSSGAPELPPASPQAMAALMSQPEDPSSRGSVIEHSLKVQRAIGSPGFPSEDSLLRERAARAYDRCHHPEGTARQMLAVVTDGSRVELLRKIEVPALVIHGEDDPLVPIECGRDTASHVSGAEFQSIPGMGHDIPLQLVDTLVERLATHALAVAAR